MIALVSLAAVVAVLLGQPTPAGALGPNDRRLNNARAGIAVEAPPGWSLSQHTGYADTIVLLLHPDGSRISVSASATAARNAQELFNQNRPGLVTQGLAATTVAPGPRSSLSVDFTASTASTARTDKMRQLYLVREVPLGRQAIVLTLVSPIKMFPGRLPALDFVVTRLTLDDPVLPTASANPASSAAHARPGPAGAGGSSAR